MKLRIGDIVRVAWHDATTLDIRGWIDKRRARRLSRRGLTVASVGYVLAVNREYLSLCADVPLNGDVGRVSGIPWGCIDGIDILKKAKR